MFTPTAFTVFHSQLDEVHGANSGHAPCHDYGGLERTAGLEDTMNEQGKKALAQRLKKLCRKTVWLRLADDDEPAMHSCVFGGNPELPETFEWPRNEHWGTPLSFIMQFDCAELASEYGLAGLLPDHGSLAFFFDFHISSCDFGEVFYGRAYWFENRSELATAMFPDDLECDLRLPLRLLSGTARLAVPEPIREFAEETPASFDDEIWWAKELGLLEEDELYRFDIDVGEISSLVAECGIDPESRPSTTKLFGWPYCIQGEIEEEHPGSRLLLQLCTGEFPLPREAFEVGGEIYFYIDEEALACWHFDEARAEFQCS